MYTYDVCQKLWNICYDLCYRRGTKSPPRNAMLYQANTNGCANSVVHFFITMGFRQCMKTDTEKKHENFLKVWLFHVILVDIVDKYGGVQHEKRKHI